MRVTALAAAATAAAAAKARVAAPVPADVLAAAELANSYFISQELHGQPGDCGWERATYFTGNDALWQATGNATLLAWQEQWGASHGWQCAGSLNANDICCGATYADVYAVTRDPAQLALVPTLDKIAAGGNVGPGSWTWLDAVYMGLPTFLRYAIATGNASYFDIGFSLYNFTAHALGGPGLWSPENGLFFRDPTYFNKTSPNGKPVFWARGNGWVISALARAIAASPAGSPYLVEYISKFRAVANTLATIQGADGMWRANLLDADAIPNPESTGSGMFTYALAWGVKNGYLDAAKFTPIVAAAWQGLSTIALQPNGFVGFCQPPNGQPAPANVTQTSDFCVGDFLLAASATAALFSA